jgi:hypothetical protein
MKQLTPLQPVDYLIIGHITIDLISGENRLGGTTVYSALTAQALGFKVGIVTSWGSEVPPGPLANLPIINYPSEQSTTFENLYFETSRKQILHHVAPSLDYYHIPETWRNAPIVHLAPVAQEVEPSIVRNFPNSMLGVTPQGWMRAWDDQGQVHPVEWPEARFVLERSAAAVISLHDIEGDENRMEEMAAYCRVLAVTNGASGVNLFWNGDVRRFTAPVVKEVDPTGAGDIFATAFFTRLFTTRDPWEASRFATEIASISVTRPGLSGIPTPEEITDCLVEVF